MVQVSPRRNKWDLKSKTAAWFVKNNNNNNKKQTNTPSTCMTSLVWIISSPTLTRSALSLQVKLACKLALQPRNNFAGINSPLWDRYVATHTNAQISAGPVWDWAPVSWLWLFAWAGIARLIKRPTEKPGAILTRVRVPGAARDFSPRVNLQRRFSYYGVLSASASVRPLKIPSTGSIDSRYIVWTRKFCTY